MLELGFELSLDDSTVVLTIADPALAALRNRFP